MQVKKIISFVVGMLMIFNFCSVFAQSVSTSAPSGFSHYSAGNDAKLLCLARFSASIWNTIDLHPEEFTEYWKDLLVRYSKNFCWYNDIFLIHERIDQARKNLHSAFLACDETNIKLQEKLINELHAEMYYMRNFINVSLNPNPNIEEEFFEEHVTEERIFTKEENDAIFKSLKNKYSAKISWYRNCSDPGLHQFIAKIKELAGIFDTLEKMTKQFVVNVKNKKDRVQARVEKNSMFYSKNFGDFINRSMDIKVNGDDITDPNYWDLIVSGKSDFGNELYNVKPGISNISIGDAIYARSSTLERKAVKESEANLFVEFEAKYLINSDNAAIESEEKLKNLLEIVQGTFRNLAKTSKCVTAVSNRQCPAN